jgi:hypothetical protein
MRMKSMTSVIVAALALSGGASLAQGQDTSAEVVLLQGAHRVPVVAFGPSLPLLVGEFVPPSAAGDFYFIAEREAFFHSQIDGMGGAPSTDTAVAATASSASGAASAGGAVQQAPQPAGAEPQWRSVGTHAFDLVHEDTVYNCFAGKISESDAREPATLGAAATELTDLRLYRTQCMGWTTEG